MRRHISFIEYETSSRLHQLHVAWPTANWIPCRHDHSDSLTKIRHRHRCGRRANIPQIVTEYFVSGNTLTTSSSVSYSFTADTSPLTIAQTVTISASISNGAVYAASTIASPSLTNLGVVINSDTAARSAGVKFLDGGYIYNTGTIDNTGPGGTAVHYGVYIGGSYGTVVNHGSIAANTGSGIGIVFSDGGSADNYGTISGHVGIEISAASATAAVNGTVVNHGSIAANTTTGTGIELRVDGTADNYGVITGSTGIDLLGGGTADNSGTITGSLGVYIVGSLGVAVNQGHISANSSSGTGIKLETADGTVDNSGTITGRYGVIIGGVGTVINDGSIIAGTSSSSLSVLDPAIMLSSGYVKNAAGAHITAYIGAAIEVTGADAPPTTDGILSGANGTVINDGIITAGAYTTGRYGNGIYLHDGGYVLNAAGATIVAAGGPTPSASTGKGIFISPPPSNPVSNPGVHTGPVGDATVVNDGTILASDGYGVDIGNGGSVTNAVHGFIYGTRFGVYTGNPGTIVNAGTISSNYQNWGVVLDFGGTVTNEAGGFIYGGYHGVGSETLQVATVINNGIISGGHDQVDGGGTVGGNGVALLGGGYVTNGPGALIDGYNQGLYLGTFRGTGPTSGTAVNAGVIESNKTAVLLTGAGYVTNTATGTITGGAAGIVIDGDGTIVNAGTIGFTGSVLPETPPAAPSPIFFKNDTASSTPPIATTSRPAIDFESSGANRLVIDPGAVFIGLVEANAAASNTLELASSSSAGTITGIGSQFTGFGTIEFDSGAQWTIDGNAAGLASGETIIGFGAGDTIDIAGLTLTPNETLTLGPDGVLTIPGTTDTVTFTGASELDSATLSPDGEGGTEITDTLCYLRGTRILTTTGEVPVEDIHIGDSLVSRFGAIRPVKWIGRQSYDLRFVRDNKAKLPVCIQAGALGEKMPARDLFVSPGHSILLDGTLVLASKLVNGLTITQAADEAPARIEYFQIEFDAHDCVIAEGIWSETYADAPGMRAQFHNAGEFYARYPDQPPREELCLCAPRPERGVKLDAAIRPVVTRATVGLAPGRFEGWIDNVSDWYVNGWAFDDAHPELPVLLEVLIGERIIGTVLAHEMRADLAAAGIGNGYHAFSHASPVRIPINSWADLRVRRACDGASLQMTPACRERIAQAQQPHMPALLRAVG
jgi:Hint domain